MQIELQRRVQQGTTWLFTHPDGVYLRIPLSLDAELGNPESLSIVLGYVPEPQTADVVDEEPDAPKEEVKKSG